MSLTTILLNAHIPKKIVYSKIFSSFREIVPQKVIKMLLPQFVIRIVGYLLIYPGTILQFEYPMSIAYMKNDNQT